MKSSGNSYWLLLSLLILTSIPVAWNGFACLSNPCIHGVCLDDLNSSYFCYCIDGYTGVQCQTNWNECWSSPCRNGGTCIDGIAIFNCSCLAGYAGDFCEEDINDRESNPCTNNGTCLDAKNGYICKCLPGYSGDHCEIDIAVCNATNETRCLNGGKCEEGPGESFTCKCRPGWGGLLCESEIDECMSAPCQNGAVCIDMHSDYSCACLFGFTGRNCEETIQICNYNPCKNGALCLIEENRPVCYCVPDFHGELCQFQYDECQLGPKCMNGGSCIDGIDNFTCSCPPRLTGVLCECLILDNNTFDCTYVSPKPSTISTVSYEPTTITATSTTTSVPTVISSTTLSALSTEVPSTEIIARTEKPDSTETAISFTETAYLYTSAIFTSEPPTTFITNIGNVSESTTVRYTSTEPATSLTTIPPGTATKPFVLSTEMPTITTTESSTQPTKSTDSTLTSPTTLITTVYPSTSTEFGQSTSTSYPTQITVQFTTPISTTPHSVTHSTIPSTISSFLPTELPLATLPEEIRTSTGLETSTVYQTVPATLVSSQTEPQGTNRSFPDTSTFFPTVTTFFTTEPVTKMETTTFLSTVPSMETAMFSTEVTSTSTTVDCTLPDTACENGGTCIFTGYEHKCICPFDSEGPQCEIKLGVRKAAFSGQSYLAHRLTNFSNILVEFEANTMANNGLLLFATVDTSYMALYIQNGHLKFKFSCGYQTMLLSELKNPVNNAYKMKIKAELEFSKDMRHCDAKIKVNDTLSMAGDQIAKPDIFTKPAAWLYLGGLPHDFDSSDVIPVEGFVGCMTNLKISNVKRHIYKDAEDGFEVTECSSLACLSSPCRNGASCSSMGETWQCHCKNGYLGKTCEISICDDNPCMFGGTCIPFTNSGYICLCPYGKHGHFCENDLKITEPYFSSSIRGLSSFVAYSLPDGVSRNLELKFRFTPTSIEQISLMLFIGQSGHHDFYSDHLSVSFVKGYIMLTWNLGSGPRRIFTSQPIKKGSRDYLVRLGHVGRKAWLYVDDLGNVTGRSPGNLVQLDVAPLLFIGGHNSRNFSDLPHDLPLHTGFSGCIFDLEMKSGSVVIPFQGSARTFGRAVGQCGITECYDRSCENGGACLHHGSTFMCLCQDVWYGPLCSSRNNLCDDNFTRCSDDSRCIPLLSSYECDCPWGKTGNHCEKRENITDVSLTGKRSYIALHPVEMQHSKFHIQLELRTLQDEGIILFIGKTDSNFVCLSLLGGLLELRIRGGKHKLGSTSPTSVRSSKLLVKAVWNKVTFGLFGRKIYLSVGNIINTGILDIEQMFAISKEVIYIGGLPDMSKFPLAGASSLPVAYTGCVRHLSFDDRPIPLVGSNVESSRNVIDCDGTPCGGEVCQNGGTCWLDSFMQPHCSCVSPFYGDKCETRPDCDDKICGNGGMCDRNKCSCKTGWNGIFCQTEIRVKPAEFTGKSYLVVKKAGDKKRELKDVDLKDVKVNFTTAKPDGLLVWSRKGNSFVGIGLEKGFLKLAYSTGDHNKTSVEIPSYTTLSDGLWHSIDITFAPASLKIDGKLIPNKWDILESSVISTNGIFYIGSVPANKTLISVTNGLFPHAFEGCLEEFGSNTEYITDFSHHEGLHINTCRVL